MAQYNSLDFDDMQFNDDLDFNFGEGGSNGRGKKPRGPIMEFGASTVRETRDELLNGGAWKNAVVKGLPGPFRETWEAYDATTDTLSSLYDQAQKEVVDPVRKIAKTIDDAIPNNVPLIKALTSKVANFLKKDGNGYGTNGNRRDTAEEDGIALMLKETFERSTEIDSIREETRERREIAKEVTRESMEKRRSERETRLWGRMDKNIQTIAILNKNVSLPFQKKSLELQARTYMTIGRLLKETKDAREENRGLLESIRHNTGIPESSKVKAGDEFKDQMRKRVVGGIQDRMFGKKSLFNKALARMKSDAGDYISSLGQTVSIAAMGADSASGMAEMMKDMPPAQAAGMMAGMKIGDYIRENLLKKIFENVEKNGETMKKGYKAANMVKNPKDAMEQLRNTEFMKAQFEGPNGEKFRTAFQYMDGLFDVERGSRKMDTTAGIDGQLDPANYTKRTQIVQNKVIPGYLARILREIQVFRTGNEKTQMTVFDPVTGTFKDASTLKEGIKRRLARETKGSSFTYAVRAAGSVMLDDDAATPEQRKAAQHAAARFANYDGSIENGKFQESKVYKNATEVERKIYDKMLGKMSEDTLEGQKYKHKVFGFRDSLRQSWGSMGAKIQEMIDAGQEDELVELGLVTRKSDGSLELNREAISEFQMRMASGKRTVTSDVNAKEGFSSAPKKGILGALKNIPISKWFYKDKAKGKGKKIGPMAQDVQRELGDEVAPGGKKLDLVSMNGVLMSAVQELSQRVEGLFQNVRGQGGKGGPPKGWTMGPTPEQLQLEHKAQLLLGYDPKLGKVSEEKETEDQGATQTDPTASTAKQRGPRFNKNTTEKRHLFNIHKELFSLRKMLETKGLFGLGLGEYNFKNVFKDFKMPGFEFDTEALKKVKDRIKPLVSTGNEFLDSLQVTIGAGIKSGFNILGSMKDVGKSAFDGVSGFVKQRYENNKDWMYESGGAFADDVLKKGGMLAGKAWRLGTETLPNMLDSGIKGGIETLKNTKNFLVTMANGPKDVYVAGNLSPVLLASKMRSGHYKNAITGKVIRNIDDLLSCKDDIADSSSQNEIALRKEDAAKGLFDKEGKELKSLMMSAANLAMGAAGWVGSKIVGAAKGLFEGPSFFKSLSDSMSSVSTFFSEKLGKMGGLSFFDGRVLGLLAQIRDLTAYRKPKKILSHVYGRKDLKDENDIKGSGFYALLTGEKEAKGPDAPESSPTSGPDGSPVGPSGPAGGSASKPWSLGGMFGKMSAGVKNMFNKFKNRNKPVVDPQTASLPAPAGGGGGGIGTGLIDAALGAASYIPRIGGAARALRTARRARAGQKALGGTGGIIDAAATAAPLLLGGPTANDGIEDVPYRDIPNSARPIRKPGIFTRMKNSGLAQRAGGLVGRIPGAGKVGRFIKGRGGVMGTLGGLASGAAGILGKAGGFLKGLLPEDTQEDSGPVWSESAFANNLTQQRRNIGSLGQGKRGVVSFNDRSGRGDRDNGMMDQLQLRENEQKEQKQQVALKAEQARKEAQETAFRFKTENVIDKMMKNVSGMLSSISAGSGGVLSMLGDAITMIPGLGSIWKGVKGIGGFGKTLWKGGKALATGARAAQVAGKVAGVGGRILGVVRGVGAVAQAAGLASGTVSGMAIAAGGTALKVIGTLLASPFMLKAAIAAGVMYGLYKGYKYFTRDKLNDEEMIRAAQYGFDKPSKDLHKLMNLENFLLDGKVLMTPGNASINYAQIEMKDLYDIFDIDKNDKEAVTAFSQWFRYRFEPFFICHVNALTMADKTKKLEDVNKLTPEAYEMYFKQAMFLEGPYDAREHPMKPGESLPNTKDDVEKAVKGLIEKKKANRGKEALLKASSTLFPLLAAATERREAAKRKSDAENSKRESDLLEKAAKDGAARPGPKSVIRDVLKKDGSTMADVMRGEDGGKAPSPGSGATGASNESKLSDANPGPLRRAGGPLGDKGRGLPFLEVKPGANFDGLNGKVKDLLLAMASEYGQKTGNKIRFTDGYRSYKEQADIYARMPDRAAKPGNSVHESGMAFDIDPTSAAELEKLGLMRKYGFTRPIGGEAWHVEPAGIQTDIQRARKDPGWAAGQIDGSPGRGGGGFGTVAGSTLKRRNPALAKKLFESGSDTVIETADKSDAKDAAPQLAFAKDVKKPDAVGGDAKGDVSAVGGVVARGELGQPMVAANEPVKPPSGNSSLAPQNQKVAAAPETRGDDASAPASGPNTGKDGGSLKAVIAKEAPKVPMDTSTLQLFAAVESSMGKNMTPHAGSARGPFQFMPDTWNEQIKKYGRKFDIPAGTPPEDPRASTLLAGSYLKANSASLTPMLGQPDIIDMYTTHFLGPSGAKSFARLNDKEIPANVMPKAAANNANIFYADGKKKTQPLTKAEIRKGLEAKFKKLSSTYGISMPKLRTSGEGGDEDAKASPLAAAPMGAVEQGALGSSGSEGGSPLRSTDTSTAPKEAPPPNMFGGNGPLGQGSSEPSDTMVSSGARKKPAVEAQTEIASGMDKVLDRVATSGETLVSAVQNDVVPLLKGIHSTLQKMFEKGGAAAEGQGGEDKTPKGPSYNRPAQKVAATSVIDRDRKYG